MSLVLYKRVRNKEFDEFIATMDAVQWDLNINALDIAIRAENLLRDNRVDNVAHIELEKGDIDTYVALVDSDVTNDENASSNSALSIEFGREGFVDPDTGEKWGASEGLYILTRAANLPKKPRAKSRRRRLSKAKAMRAIRAKARARAAKS